MKKRKNKLIAKIWCFIFGHKYPIKWSKEKWPNGEIVEVGIADTMNPCFRCGEFRENPIVDIERQYWNIADDLKKIKNKLDINE